MMGAMNDEKIHKATIQQIISHCSNVKEFYAAALHIKDKQFNSLILRPFFGRLEQIVFQHSQFGDSNDLFADCKKLKVWNLEIMYGFERDFINFNFHDLEIVTFSKVDNIDNENLARFFSKNPQLKKIEVTRCTITPKIIKLLAEYVPNIEQFAFNFRRSLMKRSDMAKNLKYLLELQHLTALNLDCCGVPLADTLAVMVEKNIPLERVGLFCCPWQDSYMT